MVDFGEKLKALRQDAGLTQKQLADKLGVTKSTVSYYELAFRFPSTDVIVNLAEVFHVTTNHLLGLENKRQTIDVTDLPYEDIEFLQNAIELLRRKNNEREISHRKKVTAGDEFFFLHFHNNKLPLPKKQWELVYCVYRFVI